MSVMYLPDALRATKDPLSILAADMIESLIKKNNTPEPIPVDPFQHAARPLIKYLAENYNPHTVVIVDAVSAELFDGTRSYVTEEFLKD